MEKVKIRGRHFTEEVILWYGKNQIRTIRGKLLKPGIPFLSIGALFLTMAIADFTSISASANPESTKSMAIGFLVFGLLFFVPGLILVLVASFIRKPYEKGVQQIEKTYPEPVGFDGKPIEVFEGDKRIFLWQKPISVFELSTSEQKFQFLVDGKYTKVFSGKDITDYEIRVDNEVVATSTTVTRAGLGRAAAGGLLFGKTGAIVGAAAANSTSRTTTRSREIHHYTLCLRVNDILKPSYIIRISTLEKVEEVLGTLIVLCDQNKEETKDEKSVQNKIKEKDKFEEIKKYKELLDAGIITQEEFDKKKKELL